jgi:putative membrane protein
MHAIIHLAVLAATVFLLARFLPSVHIRTPGTAVVVAIVFSVLNFFLGWLVRVVLFVPALLTLGLLFLVMPFVINTVMLWLTDKVMTSFEIKTNGALFLSALVITLVNAVFYAPLLTAVSRGHGYDTAWV